MYREVQAGVGSGVGTVLEPEDPSSISCVSKHPSCSSVPECYTKSEPTLIFPCLGGKQTFFVRGLTKYDVVKLGV